MLKTFDSVQFKDFNLFNGMLPGPYDSRLLQSRAIMLNLDVFTPCLGQYLEIGNAFELNDAIKMLSRHVTRLVSYSRPRKS